MLLRRKNHNRVDTILRYAVTAISVTLLVPSLSVQAQQKSTSRRFEYRTVNYDRLRDVALDAGTVIPVKLVESLNSRDARRGDTFSARLRIEGERDYSGLPAGTSIEGVVREVKPRKDRDPGFLDLEFRRLRLPDGRSYAIEGSLIGLDNDSVVRTGDGRLVAKPGKKNNRLTYVGYGAGAGLIAGLLRKRPLEDAILGAGLGYLFGSIQKGTGEEPHDVTLKAGTELGVRLDRRLAFGSYDGTENSDERDDQEVEGPSNRQRAGDEEYEVVDAAKRLDHARSNREGVEDTAEASTRDRSRDSAETGENIGVLVGDRDVRFAPNARPLRLGQEILVPFGPVLEALKIRNEYDAKSGVLRAFGPSITVRITAESRVAIVNNGERRERLKVTPRRLNGTLYVPAQFIKQVSGQNVLWDSSSLTFLIGHEE